MLKRLLSLVIIAALMVCGATVAYALDEDGAGNWYVQFTENEKMNSNYDAVERDQFADTISMLEPGDSATFYMEVENQHKESTDWYMTNEVLRTLEQSQSLAEGGAYSYKLTYNGPNGQDVLFDSEAVGGLDRTNADGRVGLREATFSLENWFYLDTLKSGEKGDLELRVALEGETQGNRYQNTMAQLQMNFAVELTNDTTTRTVYTPVRTGDEGGAMTWSVVMLGCGLAALGLAVVRTRKEKEESDDA